MLIVYLWLLRDEPRYFTIVFALVNGPLLWAIPVFRNSLVFHSIDKITSLFIHASPIVMTYVARWYLQGDDHIDLTVCKDADCSVSMVDTFVWPSAIFAAHQVLYYFLTHIVFHDSIENDPKALTVYRYLVSNNPKGMAYKVCHVFGPGWAKIVFHVLYTFQSAITMLPTILMYKYFEVHLAVGLAVIVCAIWNGANFYIEVFSRKYEGWKSRQPSRAH
jgi:Protein of unknown function (DUF2838)